MGNYGYAQYTTKPEHVEALQVGESEASMEEAAKWCGGQVLEGGVRVPTIQGDIHVLPGEYLVKDLATGRFSAYHKDGFEAKFHQVGLRQDGPQFGSHRRGLQNPASGFTDPA